MSTRSRTRLPPSRGDAVVLISQIARALGWSTSRLRSLDDVLKPMRLADGTRVYDVDRVLMFIDAVDGPTARAAANVSERRVVSAARKRKNLKKKDGVATSRKS